MMRKYCALLVLLTSVTLLGGCTADVYVPTTHNTPALEKSGDIKGAFYTSTKGTDLQGAYAFSNRFGAGLTLNYLRQNEDNSNDFQRHKYGALSLIYFLNFSDPSATRYNAFGEPVYKKDRRLKVAFLGSAGLGEGEALQNTSLDGSKKDGEYALGRYSKFSLQSNLTFEYKLFSAGFSPKISYVSFYDFKAIHNQLSPPMSEKTKGLFWEPAVFMGLHYQHIGLQLQVGETRFLSGEPAFNYDRIFISLGLNVHFNVFH